ncbi:hypothetical protein B1R32_11930 [Abditibacterium utsteinense]|uniref:Uncharacterized protein n=1 Tax=Abditibacterium utsteinense TaxID=1960156 RepID=A0A2S8SQ14_9BACT|nr:hypothetical protein B1R32_11930 [Abditibacterium utsteinense]
MLLSFHPLRFRFLLVLGVISIFSAPSFADNSSTLPETIVQKGKSKKGDTPPRPRPHPGPREGGDGD